jgi:hypothetical protein
VKCPKCGYQNKAEAVACNLCQAVLKKERDAKTARGAKPPVRKHLLLRAGAPPIELAPGATFTIGRQQTCTLPIPSNRVSRLHAEIRWQGESPILCDKGSSNGTYVGGKPVKEHPLASGDEVEIGPFHCVYRFDDPDAAPAATTANEDDGTATMVTSGDFFSGQIGEHGLFELIQGFEFNRKTGTLDIYSKPCRAWLTIQDGVALAAEADDVHDDDAILKILALKAGRFTFLPELKTQDRRVRQTITALLLEAGRRADEDNLARTNLAASETLDGDPEPDAPTETLPPTPPPE